MKAKKAEESRTVQVHVVQPKDLNGAGRLFGGALLQMIDEVAGIVAKRHSHSSNVTTAAIENLTFKCGAYNNDLLVIIGYITYTGNTSMEVRVDTYMEDTKGMRRPINRAFFIMVAMDDFDKPTKVPPLMVETESQKAEWEGALLRKKLRLERKEAGF
ncbi:MAG: acyl-CoA thioesterase [Lachnospiraceae bacterium]|nr:acyl-CoA thioesterase [Lachnospiraceae bacterium]